MRCDRARELFSDYYEGAVQTALRVPLETHLVTCPECRQQMAGLREVWRLLDTSPVVEAPVDLRATVWRRIDSAREARAQAPRRAPWALDWQRLFSRPALAWAGAAAVVLALASFTVEGRYTPAGLGGPLSAIPRPERPLPPTFAGSVTGSDASGQVLVRIANPGPEPLEARVTLLDGPAGYAGGAVDLTVPPGGEAPTVLVPAGVNPGPSPLHVRVRWTRGVQSGDTLLTISPR